MTTATTIARTEIVRYWRVRNASAPCWIASEMRCISGLPRSRDSTHRASHTANASAKTLAPMMIVRSVDCVGSMSN